MSSMKKALVNIEDLNNKWTKRVTMKDQLISFTTAKLAREKGFNANCFSLYTRAKDQVPMYDYHATRLDKMHDGWNFNSQTDIFSAPAQSLLQKWLRKKHNIYVYALPQYNLSDKIIWKVYYGRLNTSPFRYKNKMAQDTYEEALESGLQEALKLIKE